MGRCFLDREELENEVARLKAENEEYRVLLVAENRTEQEFRKILTAIESSNNEIIIFDKSFAIQFANSGVIKNLKSTRSEISGKLPWGILSDPSEIELQEYFQALKAGQYESLQFEGKLKRSDASTYPVDVRLQYIASEEVYLLIAIDISERKERERQLFESYEENVQLVRDLEETNDSLTDALHELEDTQSRLIEQEKLATLGKFSASLMHEVQNQLNPIALLDIIEPELGKEGRDFLRMIRGWQGSNPGAGRRGSCSCKTGRFDL